jgi:hypothetical protein
MSQDDFAAALEAELRLLGVPFARAELLAFAADVWTLATDDPDPARWAREFLDATTTCACKRRAEAAALVAGVAEALGQEG